MLRERFAEFPKRDPIERPVGSEIAKSRRAKALALCKAKMNDPHCDSRQQCVELRSEIAKSRRAFAKFL
ncbi:hypothetical protein [Leptospira santarosai]|uniref:hypothetical protein n=1 Tax=Leptospira santarosai TaxID=28183 RepID=UPI0039B7577B